MDASGSRIDVFHVAINIGRCDLIPLAVFLHQFKQMGQFRTVGITPLLQHNHGGIVRSLAVALGGFENRQSQVIEKIGLEGIGAAIAADIHITNHECDLTADTLHSGIGFCFTLLHQRKVHRHTVVFHDAEIYGGRTFHLFHQKSVFRQKAVKPVIEDVIQTKGKIRVGTAIADGLRIHGIQLIKMLTVCNGRKGGERFSAEFPGEFFQTGIRQLTEIVGILQRHLRCGNRVVHGRHDDDPFCVGEH